jgi:hypothetical protein
LGGKLDVDTKPREGVSVRMMLAISIVWSVVGRVILIIVVFGGGIVHFGESFFGVAGGPLGVVKIRIGGLGAGRDTETPVVIENYGRAHAGGVEDDWGARIGHFSFGRTDDRVRKREAAWRPVMMVVDRRRAGGGLLDISVRTMQDQEQEESGNNGGQKDRAPPAAEILEKSFDPAQLSYVHRALHFIVDGRGFQCERGGAFLDVTVRAPG